MASRIKHNTAEAHQKLRNTAVQHALSIEEKKQLRNKVADLVIRAFDLPSSPSADPADPLAADVASFHECLRLFQPSDLDDLVYERNADQRCGYALCPRQHRIVHGGGEKVWNHKGGENFKLLPRVSIEKWCSQKCGERTAFIRAQLTNEPAWLRDSQNTVRLLEDVQADEDLSAAAKTLVLEQDDGNAELTEKLKALSIERGEDGVQGTPSDIHIKEREVLDAPIRPPRSDRNDLVEGHRPRKVRFDE